MKFKYMFSLYFMIFWLAACQLTGPAVEPKPAEPAEPVASKSTFFRGADLSYVNEMLDCGATYLNESGVETNPYEVFQVAGANLVRVRLWHSPTWTNYSDFDDVKKTIQAAKAQNMQVLLDFHYSDTWSDPSHQEVPKAWLGVVNNIQLLGDSLYAYTYQTLTKLHAEGLLPEMVQVGNEINIEILQDPDQSYERINWSRNSALLKRGLQAVRDAAQAFDTPIASMLHVAQPENGAWWFAEAQAAGLTDYDWIGLSYYPNWSDYSLSQLSEATKSLKALYGKRVMVVETAYPFTLESNDSANNLFSQESLLPGYPATQEGQLRFLQALEKALVEGEAEGLIYWEPAWISTSCRTLWGQGSHFENATLFDFSSLPTQGMRYFGGE